MLHEYQLQMEQTQQNMKIIYFLKRKLKIILIALILCLSVLALGGAAYYYVPKYFEAKQKDRDSTRKCKSYRALAEICLLYTSDAADE